MFLKIWIKTTTRFLLKLAEDYCKPSKNRNAFTNNYIEYKSINDINKTLFLEEYLKEICSYFRNSINILKYMEIIHGKFIWQKKL